MVRKTFFVSANSLKELKKTASKLDDHDILEIYKLEENDGS